MQQVGAMVELDPALERIQNAGRWLQVLALVLMVVMPLLYLYNLLSHGPLALLLIPADIAVDMSNMTPALQIIVSVLVTVSPVVRLLSLYLLYRLFRLYVKGEVFSAANVVAIRRMGYALVMIEPLRIMMRGLIGILLVQFAVTEHQLNVKLCLAMLIVGIFVVLISYVMDMGRTLKENNDLVI